MLIKEESVFQKNQHANNKADVVAITYYTDPLCCWSWGLEPQWRKLQYAYRHKITWQYKMGGLLPGWKNFHDPVNSVSRPIQMGPVWMHAQEVTGMPIQFNLWVTDPPASSYPACIAVKCVQLQSQLWADFYLRLLREACMIRGWNIAKGEILLAAAKELQNLFSDFDIDRFQTDLMGDRGINAFRNDLNEVKSYNINRYPSLILRHNKSAPILITGYRPYQLLETALTKICPGIKSPETFDDVKAYTNFWPSITQREIAEVFPGEQ